MKLYTFPQSHNSLRVTAVAYHAGLELDLVFVDLAKAEQHSPDVVRLNPNHKIPVLVDGDYVLWESPAIMLYLAEKVPEAGLIPTDLHQRMHMHQWLAWDAMQFTPAEHVFIHEYRVKRKLNLGDPDPEHLKKGTENFHRYATVLNEHLKNRAWILGDEFSLVDYHVVAPLIHAESCHYPWAEYGEIQRWSAAVFGTRAWQQALLDVDKY